MAESGAPFWGQQCLLCGEIIRSDEHNADPSTVAEVTIEIAITSVQQAAHLACLDAATHSTAQYRAVPRSMEAQLDEVNQLRREVDGSQSEQ